MRFATTCSGASAASSLRARLLASGLSLSLIAAPALSVLAPQAALARGAPDSFADLAARLLPSVVNISSTETVTDDSQDDDDDPTDQGAPGAGPGDKDPSPQTPGQQAPGLKTPGGKGGGKSDGPTPAFPPGSPFEKFFHDFMNKHGGGKGGAVPGGPATPGRKMQSLGSGFIIDGSGLVVTNNHVIKGADTITVTLQDNTVLKAKLLGHDDKTDLALLKVDAGHPLPAVVFGDSDKSRVGDWVLAIGNPFGLSGTVTAGIVSSRGRSLDSGPYDDFIQTDAPINRGNSGGPLFDMDGGVIGINTAIYSPSGGSIGIGFSIPSNEARTVIDQLRQFGKAKRGWIGVRIQDVTQDIADSLGLKTAKGALVAGLEPNGPAAKAGLKTGDVIQQVGGKDVDGRTLPRVVGETPVGQTVPLGIWRDGKSQTLQVAIRDFPEDQPKPAAPTAPTKQSGPAPVDMADIGMKLATLDDVLRQKYQLGDSQKGVVVTDIIEPGPAFDRGIKVGDVIVEVQQSEVSTPAEIQARIAEARKQKRPSVVMLVQSGDGMRWVPLPVQATAPQATPKGRHGPGNHD
ncbi:DegQ family serine endoprotease [Lichenicola cladoniae]|uniref:Probable periplasmic serine endoprotease DegP-like n=1 Tax=Lichenicola cladoniae TaxID=1484109 RepID=A0A6M8HT18_9PROT|nr:DegQ family serine endoprotease [Lichenicola cladoniae]NPD65637.1 DegQ family serine endoprotease [Acetobacteraceae bacterium]QKE91331.1 DegQ family serine endoprotease [Lichenicola cladoniae]